MLNPDNPDAPILDRETAIQNRVMGWRWASIAARDGAAAAAEEPLPDDEEARIVQYAMEFATRSPAAVSRVRATAQATAHGAIEAYTKALPLVRASRAAQPVPEGLWRATVNLMEKANRAGFIAAKANRTLYLLTRALEVHR
jgi:hypothetical protein